MAGFSEASTIQAALVEWAVAAGWEHVRGDDLPRQTTDVLVGPWVLEALAALNPALAGEPENTDAVIAELRAAVLSAPNEGLLAANERLVTMLRGHHPFPNQLSRKHEPRRFIDFEHPERNRYVVADEVTIGVPHAGARRFDVVYYVNGFPVAVVETKTPMSKTSSWLLGARDIADVYEVEFPHFFAPNILVAATDGREMRFGAVGQGIESWQQWGDMDGPFDLAGPARVAQDAKILFTPIVLLRILASYTLFEHDTESGTKKLIPRYPQLQAGEAIHDKVLAGRPGGLIWHYQGTGKTLLCAFAAVRLLQDPAIADPTIVMVVDRIDLAQQTTRQFRTAGLPKLMVPGTRAELRDLLAAEDHRGIIVTTIHKFDEAGVLNTRDNVIVLIDEAHRTQEGTLAADMRAALPNARFFGMTGSPVADSERDTFRLFGDPQDPDFVMSVYEAERSVADGTTVPVHLEARLINFHLDSAALDEAVDDLATAEGLGDEEQAVLTKKAGRWRTIMLAPVRIDAVCADILDHYTKTIAPLSLKAQVVAADRELVVAYAQGLQALIAARGLPYEVAVDMTVGTGKDERPQFAAYRKDAKELETQKRRFLNVNDPLAFMVVTAKLMTGFDAPIEGVLYLDKPLSKHTLFQAITRPNRIWTNPETRQSKKFGLVVDYVGLAEPIGKALRGPKPGTGEEAPVDTAELAGKFVTRITAIGSMFTGIGFADKSFAALTEALQRISAPAARDQFAHDFGVVQGLWEFLDPHPVLAKYAAEYRWLAKVYDAATPNDPSTALLWERLGAKTIALVHAHMSDATVDTGAGRVVIVDPKALAAIKGLVDQGELDLNLDAHDDGDGELDEDPVPEITVQEVMDSIEAQIARRLTVSAHPAVYLRLSQKLEELRAQALEKAEDSLEFLRKALEIAKLTVRAERMEDDGTLVGNEHLLDPNVGALTQIVERYKPVDKAVIIEDVARDVDAIVRQVAFTGWSEKDDGDRRVRQELRKVLKRYGLPASGEPFDSAYAYIRENY
jgi:type I restriction enzyme R subunit